ncbi:hypothetical protein TVAG_062990 [Trichomonas vaginalis G3]|uniref:E2F/DP family winged-helix DNA-binding domain-containing protein n=1 Tax=Trichomonas vaginalis (strain ATCC PRA-98 / G3) TaxID=412133 RepID=A2DLR1_TRIV3|nr:protein dimerization protein [Trichomonas vaginalis G3]EAY18694.1 hypothetical protein TVAG_062990 [Trichomonas vaginalis G3]KAI5522593.1 protein dimerization protein [Trichomonas vaginalis G3]|eukprot:XP_001579680.1 hypothetical protein [Trichomonas vaginalis G3]
MAESGKTTLVSLTKGFISMLACSSTGEIDLVEAEAALGTSKRRLYDVANVLAGVGLVERCGKSKVRWVGDLSTVDSGTNQASLIEKEAEIDKMIEHVDKCLNDLSSSELFQNYAWVSDKDVLALAPDDEVTLFALRGPPSLTISVLEGEGDDPYQLVCRAPDGEVDLLSIGKTGASTVALPK